MNLNSSSSPFPMHHHENDHHYLPNFGPNQSSSSSLSCSHLFFNSTHDTTASSFYDHPQFNFRPQHKSDESYDYQGGSTYEMKNKMDNGLKLTLWKKEDQEGHNSNKWMSSKMRVMQKMKSEDPKVLQRSSSETDQMSSNSSSYNPTRVCSDCNTTKTPLWRSGPKGPKSLCNACGIRQRKARRAMTAVAAAASSTPAASTVDLRQTVKIKVQHKEKKKGHSSHLKKRLKTAEGAVGSQSNGKKKSGFEDLLINISNNLAFHRVFPEDEKDAAILLMALSSSLVNG